MSVAVGPWLQRTGEVMKRQGPVESSRSFFSFYRAQEQLKVFFGGVNGVRVHTKSPLKSRGNRPDSVQV